MSEAGGDEVLIQGVTLVFIDEGGRPIANASDFDASVPAGYQMREAQYHRAFNALADIVVSAYASPALTRAIEPYHRRELLRKLKNEHGCRIFEIDHGHKP